LSVLGIGTDLVAVPRMVALHTRHGERLAARLLAPAEHAAYRAAAEPAALLARRFAVKEAAAKALGTGIGAHAAFSDIELAHDPTGAPQLRLHGAAARRAEALGVRHTHISLSDEHDYALAFVILEG